MTSLTTLFLTLILCSLSPSVTLAARLVLPSPSDPSLAHPKSADRKVQGQTILNFIRDVAAVQNLGTHFGKVAHAVLRRKVVSPSAVADAIHPSMTELLSHTERLSVLVADVSGDMRDSTTVTAAISCLDMGQSTGIPIIWHAATSFGPLEQLNASLGSAEAGADLNQNTETDIVDQCWQAAANLTREGIRQVEPAGVHNGKGVFYKPVSKFPVTQKLHLDNHLFAAIYNKRQNEPDQRNIVYADETNIAIVKGLTFDTGVRLITPANTSDQITRQVRVPATLHMANRAHVHARLEEAQVSPGESRTSGALVALSVLGSGLAIIISTWAVFKVIADGAETRLGELRRAGVRAVIHGTGGMELATRMIVVLEAGAGLVLIVPLLQALVEGIADPRPSIEVTTIASVFYSTSNPKEKSMSLDPENLISGAAFQVTVSATALRLDDGFYTQFILSLTAVLLASLAVAVRELFRLATVMPSCARRPGGFSPFKALGYLRLRFSPRRAGGAKQDGPQHYRVFVEFRDDVKWDMDSEHPDEIASLLVVNSGERREANMFRGRHARALEKTRRQAVALALNHALEEHIRPADTFGLAASVTLTDEDRLAAMMAASRPFHSRLPRAWYHVTAASGIDAHTIEWYRVKSVFPEDHVLFAARLGILHCLDKVKRIAFRAALPAELSVDDDNVRCELFSLPRAQEKHPDFVGIADDCPVAFEELIAAEMPEKFLHGRKVKRTDIGKLPPDLSSASSLGLLLSSSRDDEKK